MLAFCSRRIEPVRQSNRRYITSLHTMDSVLATYNQAIWRALLNCSESGLRCVDRNRAFPFPETLRLMTNQSSQTGPTQRPCNRETF